MIAPDFRGLVPFAMVAPTKKFVETTHGTELWQALQPGIEELEGIRTELRHANSYGSDVEQLTKFKDLFARNYCNTMLLNKYFSFGPGNKQLNVKFQWTDSFSLQKIESYNPIFDALSSKYNYGVCLARMACYMNIDGDGIKHACKYMQQAAWVFEDLKQNVA